MRRREFIIVAGSAIGLWPLAGYGQAGPKRRVGILMAVPEGQPASQPISAFRNRLAELGWVEPDNIEFEYRWTSGKPELIERYAAELVTTRPDVIVSSSAPNAVALHKQSRTVPIVFLFVSDPVGMGLVNSMARPGGNITGFAAFEPSLASKWVELLKEVAPTITRAGIIYNPKTAPNSPAFVGPAESAGFALGVQVVLRPVRDDTELDRAIAEFGKEPGGGLIQVPDPYTAARAALLAGAAVRARLPLISPFPWVTSAGGLICYGINAAEQNRQAAEYVDRILKGEKAGNLPVQQPTRFELIINLKTAKVLGLTVPSTLLARADAVIE